MRRDAGHHRDPRGGPGAPGGAFIICRDGACITEEDVRDFCRGKISRFKVPRYVFFVDSYPMTASGKIQKYKLKEQGLALLEQSRQNLKTPSSAVVIQGT